MRMSRVRRVVAVVSAAVVVAVGAPQVAQAQQPVPTGQFTFAVIPDTQNYGSSTRKAIMFQQTQWIADNRARLGIAFVAHLGDIVGSADSTNQWSMADQAMRTLDAAGVPNSVVPGNHDYDDVVTGAARLYRQTFPVSRYAGATWNSPAASYGGYLGQSQFGPDPVDTQNLNNYALFTAGGMDFLVLNIEFNAPDPVVDWAKRVLAAHPTRRAIMVTHSFLDLPGTRPVTGQRAGGNSPEQLWAELVRPSCSIFLVVNGHFNSGDRGEARRTDPNACGRPVHQVLTDYQARANGGDGWLRYYTFDPAADEIRATTYSTYLDRFETDADSAFTLPYDMAAPVEPPVDPPVDPPAPAALAADAFGRSTTGGWGAADAGGAWTTTGTSSRFSVTGGEGVHAVAAGTTVVSRLAAAPVAGTDSTLRLQPSALPNGPAYLSLGGLRVGATEYGARVRVQTPGRVELHLTRNGSPVVGGVLPDLVLGAGEGLQLRLEVRGAGPTTLRARVWRTGTAEPTTWTRTLTESTATGATTSAPAVTTYLSSSTTSGPIAVRYDDLVVRGLP